METFSLSSDSLFLEYTVGIAGILIDAGEVNSAPQKNRITDFRVPERFGQLTLQQKHIDSNKPEVYESIYVGTHNQSGHAVPKISLTRKMLATLAFF